MDQVKFCLLPLQGGVQLHPGRHRVHRVVRPQVPPSVQIRLDYTGDWTFRKQAIKYHIMKEELALATGLHLLAENGQPKVSDKLTTKPGVSHDKFESYLEHAEKIALALPDISQQTVSIPRGVDPDLVLFHI